jgi:molecular chaperone Hsp33
MNKASTSSPTSDEPAAVQAVEPGAGTLALGVAARGDLRWAAVDVSAPLEEARRRLDLSPLAAVALGRALSAVALLQRFTTKNPGQLLLEVLGDGPLGKIQAEVDSDGRLRGTVGAPHYAGDLEGELRIGPAIGKGLLRVTRENQRGRYSSHVELVTGEIGTDLAHFLEQSEQIRSAVLLGVLPCPEGIAAAGGVLIEAFPGVPEEVLGDLERNIEVLPGVSELLAHGGMPGLRDAVLRGFDRDDLERHQLVYRCRCDGGRLMESLVGMERSQLEEVVDETGHLAAVCAFCGKQYRFALDELVESH